MRRRRHDGTHGDIFLAKAADEFERFICRDTAADNEEDAFSGQSAHAANVSSTKIARTRDNC